MSAEFDLIQFIHHQLPTQRRDVVLGIGDDGAVLRTDGQRQLVAVTDTLVSGVHFFADDDPADIGWKSLAVNLSDIAAMGATPAWALLNLSLPDGDANFVNGFARGFAELARLHSVDLVGGDTTRGALCISVTVLGWVEPPALSRRGARSGDLIAVSGALGDAALACHRRYQGRKVASELSQRLLRPQPRLALGQAVRGQCRAAIDLSDGLLADINHLLEETDLGAAIELARLPTTSALNHEADHQEEIWRAQLSGGDDYELCILIPPQQQASIMNLAEQLGQPLHIVGEITDRPGLRVYKPDGTEWSGKETGYEHFKTAPAR